MTATTFQASAITADALHDGSEATAHRWTLTAHLVSLHAEGRCQRTDAGWTLVDR